jgi:CheY-like chemotaxis protein
MTASAERRSVLVIEDETLLRMVAVDMLEEAGFNVVEAATADEGARILAEAHRIDGVFTDIETPGDLDGIGLAHVTHALHPNAAILVVSGRVRVEAAALPPRSRFLGKPYSSVIVLNALQELLAEK